MSKFYPRLRYVVEPEPASAPPPGPVPAVPPAPAPSGDPVKLPDDHPLVKAFNAQKAELGDSKKRLSEIDEAQKTDAQKQVDKIVALESENATLKVATLRATVAAAKGVPAELISGNTEEELNAAADKLLTFKGASGSSLPGNLRPAGLVSGVQEHEETREDRRKRLADLKR